MSQNNFTVASATDVEIMPIVQRISEAINGATISNATMALLYTIFVMSYPNISTHNLIEGIKESSGHICMLLDSYENNNNEEPLDKLKVN